MGMAKILIIGLFLFMGLFFYLVKNWDEDEKWHENELRELENEIKLNKKK